jgi:threonine efflux protein
MNTWTQLLSLVVIWTIVVVSPGPCFLAVVQLSVAGSRRSGMLATLGIAAGTILWCVLSLLGLSVLFAKVAGLYDVLRLLGAAYLIYLGVQTIRRAHLPLVRASAAGPRPTRSRALRVGFLTDISNPKAAAFFSSLFAALLPPQAPLWVQASAVAIVVGIELGWYCLVSVLFSLPTIARGYARLKRWLDYLTGLVFIGVGTRLATTR